MAVVLTLNGRDLTPYLRLQHDEGFDPVDFDRVDPQFAGVPALGDGRVHIGDAVSEKEWVVPLWLKSAVSLDAVHQLVRDLKGAIFRGAQLEYRPDGATQSTYFDLEAGRIEPVSEHFIQRQRYLRTVLRLWTRPFGTSGTTRVAYSLSTSALRRVPTAPILGDELALAGLTVTPGHTASNGRVIAYGVHRSASFDPVLLGASMNAYLAGATVRGASGALGSQYLALLASVGAVETYADAVLQPTAGAYAGRHRLFAVAQSGFWPATALALQAAYQGGLKGPTALITQNATTRWMLADLGEINVSESPTAMPPIVRLSGKAAAGASVLASPGLKLNALILLPLDISAGIYRTPTAGASGWVSADEDTAGRAFDSYPDTAIVKTDTLRDETLRFRGQPPRLPPTGSPAASGPPTLCVLQGEPDNFVGNENFSVAIRVRERFSYAR